MDLRRALGLDSVAPEENTVHYELFPHTGTPHAFDVRGSVVYSLLVTSIAPKAPLSCTDVDAPQLRALKTSCLESLLPWLSQHIWQRGRFDIQFLAYCIFFRTASVILLSRVNFLKR
ncbi:hypothetical protein F751_3594 [Auxenochlorella protothecoides]|uniref:Uncharacterized protein n=1 Tax=Auxenochlorella protothecoides TaxID=3075 RepID=A0A087SJQ2_AUXPR|nr:hypothetical protein F751_3594 [Auxenochlorella protothecoides]KFM25956.1 hypothetical protein F751_3594 [Auxenochlorella protothecoides]